MNKEIEKFSEKWDVLFVVEEFSQCETLTYDGRSLIVAWFNKKGQMILENVENYYNEDFVTEFTDLVNLIKKEKKW